MSHGFVHSVLSSFDPNAAAGLELYFRFVSELCKTSFSRSDNKRAITKAAGYADLTYLL